MSEITYAFEPDLSVEDFVAVLRSSTLAARRPIDDLERLARMLAEADLIAVARSKIGGKEGGEDRIVGVARTLTDFSFCTYLSDLAVDVEFQGKGIGRELIRRTHERAGLDTTLILLAAPKAETYYPHIGLDQHHSCWVIPTNRSYRSDES